MELIVAVISLMWVIDILTLQRLDSTIDEFVKADAYYLSLEQNGAINQTRLSVKSLLPATAITHLVPYSKRLYPLKATAPSEQ